MNQFRVAYSLFSDPRTTEKIVFLQSQRAASTKERVYLGHQTINLIHILAVFHLDIPFSEIKHAIRAKKDLIKSNEFLNHFRDLNGTENGILIQNIVMMLSILGLEHDFTRSFLNHFNIQPKKSGLRYLMKSLIESHPNLTLKDFVDEIKDKFPFMLEPNIFKANFYYNGKSTRKPKSTHTRKLSNGNLILVDADSGVTNKSEKSILAKSKPQNRSSGVEKLENYDFWQRFDNAFDIKKLGIEELDVPKIEDYLNEIVLCIKRIINFIHTNNELRLDPKLLEKNLFIRNQLEKLVLSQLDINNIHLVDDNMRKKQDKVVSRIQPRPASTFEFIDFISRGLLDNFAGTTLGDIMILDHIANYTKIGNQTVSAKFRMKDSGEEIDTVIGLCKILLGFITTYLSIANKVLEIKEFKRLISDINEVCQEPLMTSRELIKKGTKESKRLIHVRKQKVKNGRRGGTVGF